jgi:glycerol uptake facilitator-like aquaporin
MPRPVRDITELVGTFIFLSVIALSAPAGPLAPVAIGTALMAMVFMSS